ncbi:MAG: DEAD/DEAH box helicase [Actinomycetes bacterium]
MRDDFAAARRIRLDDFQLDAFDALDAGESVLVAAPTGSGKTLVAEYAIEAAIARGEKAFYTTPLKALSNQKFTDFVARYGADRVGLLTGDNTLNGEASIVVMTTEVLRNMIYAASPTLDDLAVVVLDEVHYLQDRSRGPVWEEVIVHLDLSVQLVCLSATVANADEVTDWIAAVRGPARTVVTEHRPVTLHDWFLVGERDRDDPVLLPTFVDAPDGRRPNPEAQRLGGTAERPTRRPGPPHARRGRQRVPTRDEVVELLDREHMLPAIVFVFSRAGCDQAVDHARGARVSLTTLPERAAIRAIAEAHTAGLADDELAVLGYGAWLDALEAGIGAHHAGLVPPFKEAVEEAFTAGLVKVVFATETLALGVNMPARSVVIEKCTKFTGERHEFLTPGEYTQLTGRAGRRGIDDVGHALVLWSPFITFDQVASIAARGSDPLVSAFRPTYNMAVNLVRRYDEETAHRLLNLSFAQYRADRDVVVLERELQRSRGRLQRAREALVGSGAATTRPGRPRNADRAVVARALELLRPGDVLLVGRRSTRTVVLGRDDTGGRKGARILTVDASREVRRLGPDDFVEPPVAVAHLDLPTPYAPRNPGFRRAVADAARTVKVPTGHPGQPGRSRTDDARADDRRVSLTAAVTRAQRDVERLERRVAARGANLARQFDRILGLLTSWGYVEDWSLSPTGVLLTRISSECDLVITEAMREGWLGGLSAPELAAVVSCFTYQRRGPDVAPPTRWPTKQVADRFRRIERRWRDLDAAESDFSLPNTRPPDPGFAPVAYEWARGDLLHEVLAGDLPAGDFVRNTKQLVDLLRQIADVSPDPGLSATARRAVRDCLRGVIAAASAVGTGPTGPTRPAGRADSRGPANQADSGDPGDRGGADAPG